MELRLGNEKSAADAGDWNSSKKNDARKKRTNGAAEKQKGGSTYFPSAAANKSQFLSSSLSEAAHGGASPWHVALFRSKKKKKALDNGQRPQVRCAHR